MNGRLVKELQPGDRVIASGGAMLTVKDNVPGFVKVVDADAGLPEARARQLYFTNGDWSHLHPDREVAMWPPIATGEEGQ